MSPAELDEWMALRLPEAEGPRPWRDGARRWVLPVCPWNAEHDNDSAYVVQFAGGGVQAGCHHNGCSGRGWRDLVALFLPGAAAGTPPCIAAAWARPRRRSRTRRR